MLSILKNTKNYSHAHQPLQMKPFRDSLAWLVGGEPLLQEWPGFYLATYATLGCVYLAATALPSIWVPLQLVGATAGKHLVVSCYNVR